MYQLVNSEDVPELILIDNIEMFLNLKYIFYITSSGNLCLLKQAHSDEEVFGFVNSASVISKPTLIKTSDLTFKADTKRKAVAKVVQSKKEYKLFGTDKEKFVIDAWLSAKTITNS